MEQRIFDIIMQGDEITWQSLIYDLVKSEGMDPWDIDVSKLTFRYIEMLKKIKEMDLRISGKVVLAAAILLKVKSNYLLEEDVLNFDKLMHPEEYTEDALYEHEQKKLSFDPTGARLIPRTPQPRKRKVSIYELVDALRQALEVRKRRKEILESINITVPEKKIDISKVIEMLYSKISGHLSENDGLTFRQLVKSGKKEDVIGHFIPLLHLSNEHKVDLEQNSHFGEIEIMLHDETRKTSTGSATIDTSELNKEFDFVNEALKESGKERRKNAVKKRKGSS
ncbi:segregation/condensation protein A [Candidatus Woesearchaeota archaeon]|nr:segregation/condensation protein A [Candidatus Woesearchaeota archaeon]